MTKRTTASWCTVAEFTNPITAQIARGRLEAEGIDVFLVGENFMWGYAQAVSAMCLQVPNAQRERALLVLRALDNGDYSIVEE